LINFVHDEGRYTVKYVQKLSTKHPKHYKSSDITAVCAKSFSTVFLY